jgi:hypothetical protein
VAIAFLFLFFDHWLGGCCSQRLSEISYKFLTNLLLLTLKYPVIYNLPECTTWFNRTRLLNFKNGLADHNLIFNCAGWAFV